MKKQVVAIVGILAATAIMICLAALYGNRNRFDYLKDLDKTVFTLDGTDYQLRDMTYYIARQEMEIEKQAMVYDPDDTNAYWGLHTNGKFVRLEAKRAVLDRVVHDMMFYEAAKKEDMELDEKEQQGFVTEFEPPVVYASEEDPTVCVVELEFHLASVPSQIYLTAHISI